MNNIQMSTKSADKYEDKGVFRYGLTYVSQHESLHKFLRREKREGHKFSFPDKEFGMVFVLDKTENMYKAYDIFKEKVIWRIPRHGEEEVFTVDSDGKALVYTNGSRIYVQSVQVHPKVEVFMKPMYFSREHRWNPGLVAEERQDLTDQADKIINSYLALKTHPKLLRVRKMLEKCFAKPQLLASNSTFLRLYKIMLENENWDERMNLERLHKISSFNEIKFTNDLHKVRHIQLSSLSDHHQMLLTLDGAIHKYHLADKELIYRF